jgi:hypothetical protein
MGGFQPFLVWGGGGGGANCQKIYLVFNIFCYEIPKHTRETSFVYGFFEFGFL